MKKNASGLLAFLCVLALLVTMAAPAFAAGAVSAGWQQTQAGWQYLENGEAVKGVRWIEAEGGRYIFDENGILQTGDSEGDVLTGGNLYYINPEKDLSNPRSCYAVRNYTRERGQAIGTTYYDGDGITFVGWIKDASGSMRYQTRIPQENVPGATKDLYIYVWHAQYLNACQHPDYPGDEAHNIPAGWYLFDDNGVRVLGSGEYDYKYDGDQQVHHYTLTDGVITAIDGEPAVAPGTPQEPEPVEPSAGYNIDNVPEPFAIEADITMTGSGTGYQAKLVFVTPTAGVTFGPQFDTGARAPYTNRNVLLVENILGNHAGGQDYHWAKEETGGIDVPLGAPIHLMIGLDKTGHWSVYYNGERVGSYYNPNLDNLDSSQLKARLEVSGKHDGCTVDATFTNIKVKNFNESVKFWQWHELPSCPTIHPSPLEGEGYNKNLRISGTVTGLGGRDWDSAYDIVSGIQEFEIWF